MCLSIIDKDNVNLTCIYISSYLRIENQSSISRRHDVASRFLISKAVHVTSPSDVARRYSRNVATCLRTTPPHDIKITTSSEFYNRFSSLKKCNHSQTSFFFFFFFLPVFLPISLTQIRPYFCANVLEST